MRILFSSSSLTEIDTDSPALTITGPSCPLALIWGKVLLPGVLHSSSFVFISLGPNSARAF